MEIVANKDDDDDVNNGTAMERNQSCAELVKDLLKEGNDSYLKMSPGLLDQLDSPFNSTKDFLEHVAFNKDVLDISKSDYGAEFARHVTYAMTAGSTLSHWGAERCEKIIRVLVGAAVQRKIQNDLTLRKNLSLVTTPVQLDEIMASLLNAQLHAGIKVFLYLYKMDTFLLYCIIFCM